MNFKILIITTLAAFTILVSSCKKDEVEVYHYSFFSVKWDDVSSDEDEDGYITSGILNCLINLEENVTRNIYAQVYYKSDNSDEYIHYTTTDIMLFNGADSPFFLQIPIGSTETELAYGTYDFIVEIFEEGALEPSLSSAKETEFIVTNSFERLADDQIYTILASWNSDFDNNGDGYVRSSVLYYDVNILTDLDKSVYAEIYLKNVDSTSWTLYKTSSPFIISGSQNTDIDSVVIGQKPNELENGSYNFKILVYETGGFFPVALLDDQTSTALSSKLFQTLFDDSYYYTIKGSSIVWTGITDGDIDTYWESATLEFDVDVDKDATRNVKAKVYVKHQDSTDYICYDSTDVFSINYNSETDKKAMLIDANTVYGDTLYLRHAEYDFIISIYENTTADIFLEVCSVGDSTNANLSKQKFERP